MAVIFGRKDEPRVKCSDYRVKQSPVGSVQTQQKRLDGQWCVCVLCQIWYGGDASGKRAVKRRGQT